ncbi:hypothetical protein D3C74_297850 [compost metagenome]
MSIAPTPSPIPVPSEESSKARVLLLEDSIPNLISEEPFIGTRYKFIPPTRAISHSPFLTERHAK